MQANSLIDYYYDYYHVNCACRHEYCILPDRDHVVFSLLSLIFGAGAAETDPSQVSPVQQVRQPLSSVPLDDALAPRLLAETEHELSQLVTGLVGRTEPPVHDVNTLQRQ